MKSLLQLILFGLISYNCYTQDMIILLDGNEFKSKVLEVDKNYIKYKKYANLKGPSFNIKTNQVFMIKYGNGTKDIIKNLFNFEDKGESEIVDSKSKISSDGFYYFKSLEKVINPSIWSRSSLFFALKFRSNHVIATAVRIEKKDIKNGEHLDIIKSSFHNEVSFKRYFSNDVSHKGALITRNNQFIIKLEDESKSNTITIYGEILDNNKLEITFENPPTQYNIGDYSGVFELQHNGN